MDEKGNSGEGNLVHLRLAIVPVGGNERSEDARTPNTTMPSEIPIPAPIATLSLWEAKRLDADGVAKLLIMGTAVELVELVEVLEIKVDGGLEESEEVEEVDTLMMVNVDGVSIWI